MAFSSPIPMPLGMGAPQVPVPWAQRINAPIANNANMLMQLGLGLLDKRQNNAVPFSAIGQQALAGRELDRQRQAETMTERWLMRERGLTREQAQEARANPVILAELMKGPKPTEWARLDDNTLFNPATAETREAGGTAGAGSMFSGNSVEAQALNYGIENGMWTPEQAADLATGKPITNPADGSIYFFSGQDLIRRAPDGTQTPAVPSAPGGMGGTPPPLTPSTPAPPPAATMGGTQLTPPKPGGGKTEFLIKGETLLANAEPDYHAAVQSFDKLSDVSGRALNEVYRGRFFQSGEYQATYDSVKNVVQSYIYAVSGQQAPEQEVQRNISLVLPSIEDKPPAIRAKKARFDNMMAAIRERANQGGSSASPVPTFGNGAPVRKYNPQTGRIE